MIFLVGLPGSGKSTVGRQLGRRLRIPFIDSDQAIEMRLGCTIRAFFEREGEAAFRDVEAQVIDGLTLDGPRILATGGGAILRPENRQCLRERGYVVYLKSQPEELLRRVRHDAKRPLLQVADPLQRLRELFGIRDPLYQEVAHYTVETGRPSVGNLVQTVMAQLALNGLIDAPDAAGPARAS
jgi:shikimate kinase